jgi:hypothetical protein
MQLRLPALLVLTTLAMTSLTTATATQTCPIVDPRERNTTQSICLMLPPITPSPLEVRATHEQKTATSATTSLTTATSTQTCRNVDPFEWEWEITQPICPLFPQTTPAPLKERVSLEQKTATTATTSLPTSTSTKTCRYVYPFDWSTTQSIGPILPLTTPFPTEVRYRLEFATDRICIYVGGHRISDGEEKFLW